MNEEKTHDRDCWCEKCWEFKLENPEIMDGYEKEEKPNRKLV